MATTFPNVPGVQIKEVRLGAPPIIGVGTSTAGFVGAAPKVGRFPNVARLVTSSDQFKADYILADPAVAADTDATRSTPLSRAVLGFFANGGTTCYVVNVGVASPTPAQITAGIARLEPIDAIAIIAAPGQTDDAVQTALKDQAERTGDRFAILDPPPTVAALTVSTTSSLLSASNRVSSMNPTPRITISGACSIAPVCLLMATMEMTIPSSEICFLSRMTISPTSSRLP